MCPPRERVFSLETAERLRFSNVMEPPDYAAFPDFEQDPVSGGERSEFSKRDTQSVLGDGPISTGLRASQDIRKQWRIPGFLERPMRARRGIALFWTLLDTHGQKIA